MRLRNASVAGQQERTDLHPRPLAILVHLKHRTGGAAKHRVVHGANPRVAADEALVARLRGEGQTSTRARVHVARLHVPEVRFLQRLVNLSRVHAVVLGGVVEEGEQRVANAGVRDAGNVLLRPARVALHCLLAVVDSALGRRLPSAHQRDDDLVTRGQLFLGHLDRARDLAGEGKRLEEAHLPRVKVRGALVRPKDAQDLQVFEEEGGAVALNPPLLGQFDDLLGKLDAVKGQHARNHLPAPDELGADKLEGGRVLVRAHLLPKVVEAGKANGVWELAFESHKRRVQAQVFEVGGKCGGQEGDRRRGSRVGEQRQRRLRRLRSAFALEIAVLERVRLVDEERDFAIWRPRDVLCEKVEVPARMLARQHRVGHKDDLVADGALAAVRGLEVLQRDHREVPALFGGEDGIDVALQRLKELWRRKVEGAAGGDLGAQREPGVAQDADGGAALAESCGVADDECRLLLEALGGESDGVELHGAESFAVPQALVDEGRNLVVGHGIGLCELRHGGLAHGGRVVVSIHKWNVQLVYGILVGCVGGRVCNRSCITVVSLGGHRGGRFFLRAFALVGPSRTSYYEECSQNLPREISVPARSGTGRERGAGRLARRRRLTHTQPADHDDAADTVLRLRLHTRPPAHPEKGNLAPAAGLHGRAAEEGPRDRPQLGHGHREEAAQDAAADVAHADAGALQWHGRTLSPPSRRPRDQGAGQDGTRQGAQAPPPAVAGRLREQPPPRLWAEEVDPNVRAVRVESRLGDLRTSYYRMCNGRQAPS